MAITTYGDLRRNTLLSLVRYAQIMGIDPIRFFGGYSSLRPVGGCDDTWFEYTWQDGVKVSREEILIEIIRAEQEIADFVGFWPAPRWMHQEEHAFPQSFQRSYRAVDGGSPSGRKNIKLQYGYILYGGVRATSELTTATKEDDIDTTGDGYDDTAVWTITGIDFTANQIHAFIKPYLLADAANCRTDPESYGADQAWQIRDIRIQYDSTTEIATVYVPRYQMLKPQLLRIIDVAALDVSVPGNFVDDLVFYRVYNDPSTQVQFLWTSDAACATVECAWSTQNGCLSVSNARLGNVLPSPGTYSAVTDTYASANWTENKDPDKMLVSYRAGFVDPYTRDSERLSTFWSGIIAKLATSRIPRHFCNCENIQALVDRWQQDTSEATTDRSYITALDLANPFGTKVGEIEVYRALKRYELRVKQGVNTYL